MKDRKYNIDEYFVCLLVFILIRLLCCCCYRVSGRFDSMADYLASFDVILKCNVCGGVHRSPWSLMSNSSLRLILLIFPFLLPRFRNEGAGKNLFEVVWAGGNVCVNDNSYWLTSVRCCYELFSSRTVVFHPIFIHGCD